MMKDWEEYKSIFRTEVKATERAFDRMKEAVEKVAKDEARKLSTVQEIMIRSTDYLRRIIAPAGAQGGVIMSYLCPHCNSFPMEDNIWWVSVGKSTQIGGVRSVEKKWDWKEPDRLLVVQTNESVNQAKVFKAHVVPEGLCGNLITALKLLANQQEDGDGLVQNIVTNLCEVSRKGLTEGLRNFIQGLTYESACQGKP